MFGLGPMEIMVILVVALIFIGPQKLPEIAKSLGKSMRDLQRSANDFQRDIVSEVDRDQKPKPIVPGPQPVPAAGQEAFEDKAPDPYQKAAEEDAALAKAAAAEAVPEGPLPAPAEPMPVPASTGAADLPEQKG